MDKLILKAEKRKVVGRKVKKLRNEGLIPGNIYGKKVKSESIQVKADELEKAFKEVGETGLLELQIGEDKRPVLIHNIQVHPLSDKPLHVDFFQVNLKEKVTAKVPVELVGESPAEKQALGTVVQYLSEIEVEALPSDLPEKFEIDTSNLTEVDQTIYLKDLKYDKQKIEIKEDLENIIAKVEPPKEEKEEVVAPPAEGEEGAVSEEVAQEGGTEEKSEEKGDKEAVQ